VSFTYKLFSFFQSNQDNGGSTVGLLAITWVCRNVRMKVVLVSERKPLPKQMHYELLLKRGNQQPSLLVYQKDLHQRRSRIRSAGVDSGRILPCCFGPGAGVGIKNLWKFGPGVIFSFSAAAEVCVLFIFKAFQPGNAPVIPPFSRVPVHIILHTLYLLVVVGYNVSL